MKLFEEKWEDYRKNLACMQEVTNRLLGHMKGHGYSFRQEITDSKGAFSQEKLCGLVKELVEHWAQTLREGMDKDPDTGESLAEPYIRERRELYGLYLYLVMRCSLCEGAYACAYPYGFTAKERTDFAFLLEQARHLSRSWCVMADAEGGRKNELYEGYDSHFGFHLYKPFTDPEGRNADSALSPSWNLPQDRLDFLTNEGNKKRIFIRRLTDSSPEGKDNRAAPAKEADPDEAADPAETAVQPEAADPAETAVQPEAAVLAAEAAQTEDSRGSTDGNNGCGSYDDDDYDDYDGYDPHEDYDVDDPYPFPDFETKAAFETARMEQWAEEDQRAAGLAAFALEFTCQDEYLEACRRFTVLFGQARPDVLRDFYQELEEIVNLYLLERNLTPLADTDKTLNVYSGVYDGPCQQADSYERRLQWENQ